MNKIVVINKESGMTSRDVVNKLTSLFGTKKIGHTGTLDPLATGVLVVVIGKYTKLADIITSRDKEYLATIKLGIETDTLDITGDIIKEVNTPNLDIKNIIDVLNSFLGTTTQTTPLYSAVHVNGKRLYEYARNNEKVELPKRTINISNIELISYQNDEIIFKVTVSKGTYIRSLIKDICTKLNVIGTMSSLTRTRQGNFKIEDSYTLEDVKNNNYNSLEVENVLDTKIVEVDNELEKKVINGNKLYNDYKGYVLFIKSNERLALYNFIDNEGRLIIKY